MRTPCEGSQRSVVDAGGLSAGILSRSRRSETKVEPRCVVCIFTALVNPRCAVGVATSRSAFKPTLFWPRQSDFSFVGCF